MAVQSQLSIGFALREASSKQKFYRDKKNHGLCNHCGNPRLPGKAQCGVCLPRQRYWARQRYLADPQRSKDAARRHRVKNLEHCKARSRAKYKNDPEYFRHYELKRRYGITVEQYAELEAKQKGLCAICGHPPTVGKRILKSRVLNAPRLYVDHDHKSGAVRGLLCHWCNSHIIAGIEKSGATLAKIADYLGVTP